MSSTDPMLRRGPIAFVINSLQGGGAERVFCTIVDRLCDGDGQFDGSDVHVVLLDDAPEQYRIDAPVTWHRLDGRGSSLRSLRQLRTLFRSLRPDVAISFLTRANVANILGRRAGGHRAIISERVNTSSHFGTGLRGRIGRATVRATYPKADALIAVSQGVQDDLTRHFGVDPQRCTVIHNPYDIDKIRSQGREEPEIALPDRFIVAIGRLTENKNFAMLVEAFAKADLDTSLVILGEGEDRAALRALAVSLGVGDRVLLPGFVRNPYAVLARAAFYAASSNAEGFPNAMAEAMALGRAVVATDCPSGPSELLLGSSGAPGHHATAEYGILVPTGDVVAMASGLKFMSLGETADAFGAKGAARVEDFRAERIAEKFATFIRKTRM